MTIYEWQASTIERSAGGLAHWVGTTREDRLDWRPSAEEASDTRSVLNIALECVNVNRRLAALLRGSQPPAGEPAALANAEEAKEQLIASGKELADAVRGLDEAAMGRDYQTPFGPMPGAAIISIPVFNMQYHGGQINYIQRLYGDTEFVPPPGFGR